MSFLSKLFGSKSESEKPQTPAPEKKKVAPAIWEQTLEDDDEDDEDFPSYEDLVAQAEAGDIEAMVTVGMAHIEGEGADINLKKGLEYIDRAARLGSLEAAGLLYEWSRDKINGLGKEKEEVMAYRELGARAGDVVAQFQLAQCYAKESDRWSDYQQDKPLAHFWFAQASAQGNFLGALGYAAGLMQGFAHVGPAPRDENDLIIIPTKEQRDPMVQSDPQAIEALRANAWDIIETLSGSQGAAAVIVNKLLAGVPKENVDYTAIYKSIMESMDSVRTSGHIPSTIPL